MNSSSYLFLINKSKIIVLFILLTSYICSAQTGIWNELHPANSPSPRRAFAMADIGDGKLIIFGGEIDKTTDETWIYDYKNNIWTQINSDIHPSRRFNQRMTSITKNKVIMFGGLWVSPTDLYFYNDTWIFDLGTMSWTEMKPLNPPPGREDFCMAQLTENQILIFSGERNDTLGNPDDTWIYDLNKNTWIQMSIMYTYKRPSKTEGALMAQIDSGKVLFYGGWGSRKDGSPGLLDETWLFDSNTLKWSELVPKTNSIPIGHSYMANISKNQVAFWGGDVNSYGNYDELWIFNLNDSSWKKINTNIKPDGRYLHCLTKLGQDSIILFGGLNNFEGIEHNDTWLLTFNDLDGVIYNHNNSENFESVLINDKNKIFNFEVNGKFNSGHLYDVYGKMIDEISVNYINDKSSAALYFQQLSNGIYFMTLYAEKKVKVVKIMVGG